MLLANQLCDRRLPVKKFLLVLAILVVVIASQTVWASPKCNVQATWEVPAEGAVAMFREGDRSFGVGVASGGAGAGKVKPERFPAPDCDPISNSKCAQNVETCSGSCVAYLHYYCKTCDCGTFRFCG